MDRRRIEISLGILVLAALGILAYIAVKTGHLKGLGQTVRATVVFDNASGLVEDASVKVAGVKIGRVESLEVDFDKARATLLLDRDAGIRRDAQVAIRARSLLGEKYVEIRPQSRDAPLIKEGMELEAGPIGLDMDELVGELGPLVQGIDTKKIGELVADLHGLVADNREGVSRAVVRVDSLLARLDALRFDDPAAREDVVALIHNLRVASEGLPALIQDTGENLAELSRRAGPMLEKIDRSVSNIEPALAGLPETMVRLNRTLNTIETLAKRLDPLLERVDHVDYSLVRKLLREEGLLVRFKGQEVEWEREQLLNGSPQGCWEGEETEGASLAGLGAVGAADQEAAGGGD